MKFVMPDEPPDLVAELMASASLKTAEITELKTLCHRAGVEIDTWRTIGQQIVEALDTVADIKVSAMASDRLVIEQQKRITDAMSTARELLRAQLAMDPALPPSDQVAA